jgi:hypothetical protein
VRESADSYETARYGKPGRGKQRHRFDDDEPAFAKRRAHQPRLQPEDAHDATDGLPEGDRWSTWDKLAFRIRRSWPARQGPEGPRQGSRPGR